MSHTVTEGMEDGWRIATRVALIPKDGYGHSRYEEEHIEWQHWMEKPNPGQIPTTLTTYLMFDPVWRIAETFVGPWNALPWVAV